MEDTNPKTFVFVLMTFGDEFADIYQVGIKQACRDAGAYCERVDEQMFTENILERIFNQIAKADVIVADMTGRNPNVFYETGYAHALNKTVILLTQKAKDIPFDLTQYPHVIYGGKIAYLKTELERRIRWCIQNPKKSLRRSEFTLDLYCEGNQCLEGTTSPIKFNLTGNPGRSTAFVKLDFHNPTNQMYSGGGVVGVIASEFFQRNGNKTGITLPDKKVLHILGDLQKLFPGAWQSFPCWPEGGESESGEKLFEFTVRVFTEFGTKDFPLKMLPN